MNKSILLTRSKEYNTILKKELDNYGFKFIDCSVIKYQLLRFDLSSLKPGTDLIITSYFAANNIPYSTNIGSIWLVGKNSKSILENKGYKVNFCGKSVYDLKQRLLQQKDIVAVYLSGNYITESMPDCIKRIIFYNVLYKEDLLQSETTAIQHGVNYIVLYSENSAITLLNLLLKNNLIPFLDKAVIVAISEKVAKVVQKYFRHIHVCYGGSGILHFLKSIK